LGWTPLTAGGLDIVKIPGDHLSMLHEPNIAVLAEKMTQWLSRYEREHGATSTAEE
jgi:thioesterase domain-containing protein